MAHSLLLFRLRTREATVAHSGLALSDFCAQSRPFCPSNIRHHRRSPVSPRNYILPTDSRLGLVLRPSSILIAQSCLLRECGADILPSFHLELTCEPYVYVTMFHSGLLYLYKLCPSHRDACLTYPSVYL